MSNLIDNSRPETISVIENQEMPQNAGFLPALLANLQEGVCLIDGDGRICAPVSGAMRQMLAAGELTGRKLTEVLKTRLPQQTYRETNDFLQLLFDEDIEPEILDELNPLKAMEFAYQESEQIWENSRVFNWRFFRSPEHGRPQSVVCIVADITKEQQLAGKAHQSGLDGQRQLDWLVSIVHLETHALSEFINGCEQGLAHVDEVLAQSEGRHPASLVEEIYRAIYMLRGNASLMGLSKFVDMSERMLTVLRPMRALRHPQAEQFIPVVFAHRDLRNLLEEMREVFIHVSEIHKKVRARRSHESELLINSVAGLVASLGRELGKQVAFEHNDFDAVIIPYRLRNAVRDIIYLIARHVLYYCIEKPDERRNIGKSPVATLHLSSFMKGNELGINVRHDGRILQIESQIEKILDPEFAGQPGNESLENANWANVVFMPMIVGEESANASNGYSLDLELLRKRVRALKGRLKLALTSQEHCDYTIQLPSGGQKK